MTDRRRQIREIADSYQIPREGIDMRAVEQSCRPVLETLCEDAPEDWLAYSYSFLQARFFPENFRAEKEEERRNGVRFLLDTLNALFEKERREIPFDARRDFDLMRPEEAAYCGIREEYRAFETCFYDEYVYAFLRLSRVCTPFNTLGHVAGVHHVAMYMARQLLGTEVQVDPGLMSAAAMVHDMGKFGCRPMESRRVPYLHYYYTYQFCRQYQLPVIGSIASNHSVWDLELENLSCESLLLIYADFRVKSVFDGEHRESIRFWTLKESFDVILSKLDNVDEAKRQRYTRVYAKLRDFEEYLISLGCRTELSFLDGTPEDDGAAAREKNPESAHAVLMTEPQVAEAFKNLAIRFNLSVMHDANYEDRFTALLERIRSEKDWRHVRAFLTVAGEYSAYFPLELKKRLLAFLRDMMSYQEGDIRRQAAAIAGRMIANYEISFTKEVPSGYSVPRLGERRAEIWDAFLGRVLSPDLFMQERQIRWTGYALKTVLEELLRNSPAQDRPGIVHVFVEKCRAGSDADVITFILIDCASQIPYALCGAEDAETMSGFAETLARNKTGEIRVAAMYFLLGWLREGFRPKTSWLRLTGQSDEEMASEPYCLRYLDARINEYFGVPSMKGIGVYGITGLYLENQRAEVPWIYKYMNLEILHRLYEKQNDGHERYQYASHLLHLLQFGGRIVNRLQAGEHLADVMGHLQADQRYEILLELARALEISEYAVAKYIPEFLGRLLFQLDDEGQHDFLERMGRLITGTNRKAAVVALETVGSYLRWYPSLHTAGGDALREEALGLLSIGLSHYETEISMESLYITGQRLFGEPDIPDTYKADCFSWMARKILSLTDWNGDSLTRYFKAAALHYLYSFISDYEFTYGRQPLREEEKPCAFFPGTFDPFSLGHARIVEEIRKRGYRVYLAEDEFSWSKRTQPFEVRRKIIEMSTAHMPDVCLFPGEIPVNIAFPEDIRRLIRAMGGRTPVIAVGSDVILNASAYRKKAEEDSVQTLPHLVFMRDDDGEKEAEISKRLSEKPDFLLLPPSLTGISSTRIRENVNEGREISTLVNSLAENYIRTYGLYVREPAFKKAARYVQIRTILTDDGLSIAGAGNDREISGKVCYHEIDQGGLYGECGDVQEAARLRAMLSGKIAVITRVEGTADDLDDQRLTAVNEALEYLQENSFSYAVCFCFHEYEEILKTHGFVSAEGVRDTGIVDLRNPVVLFYDTLSSVKDEFQGDRRVRLAVRGAHLALLESMTAMYPGQLILCFESGVMNYRLVNLIREENCLEENCPEENHPEDSRPGDSRPEENHSGESRPDENDSEESRPEKDRPKTGQKMCVPFGKILKDNVIPDTVTKGLDTDKVYDEELAHFTISEFPGYAPLEQQLRAVRSFYRPVMLVDDLFHSGYRAEKILECCEKEGIEDVQLITGVLTGRGRDLSVERGIRIRSVYSVPNMKSWFIESDLYPFLGGDSVRSGENAALSGSGTDGGPAPLISLPSINMILPYEIPAFLRAAGLDGVYHLSETCLENARNIFLALEEVYSERCGRRLIAGRLGEVIAQPRHPDSLSVDERTLQELTSSLLERQQKRLRRLKYPMSRQ